VTQTAGLRTIAAPGQENDVDAMTDVVREVRAYIVEELVEGRVDAASLSEQMNLVEEEILDSLGIMSIVEFLEERFGVEIDPAEIEIDNFETLAAIANLVAEKQGNGRSSDV
jgi:acyl carrier protein